MSKSTLISVLSKSLDGGSENQKFSRWRPNVGVALAIEVQIDRLILLYEKDEKALARLVVEDAKHLRHDFEVELMEIEPSSYEPRLSYLKMLQLGDSLKFNTEDRYYLNISTCTYMQQICFSALAESRRWPVKLVQCIDAQSDGFASTVRILDTDLSRFDAVTIAYPLGTAEEICRLKNEIPTRDIYYNAMIEEIHSVVLRSRSPIMLTGPAGAGKTTLARSLHSLRTQSSLLSGRFVEVNCSALAGRSLAVVLSGFNQEPVPRTSGHQETALKLPDKGVLFIDEIDELGLPDQARLLQAIEGRIFTPAGAESMANCDFQLVTATKQNLKDLAENGFFRKDLLARLSTWVFKMQSLRERLDDIEPNLEYELRRSCNPLSAGVEFSAKARALYLAFATSGEAAWEDYFRGLWASVERMITLCKDRLITESVVQNEIETLRARWAGDCLQMTADDERLSDDYVSILIPSHTLNQFEYNQLNFVIRVALSCPSYAELSRRLYGYKAGINAAQKSRSYLVGYGLTLDMIKEALRPSSD